ncbi:MAG TPA: 23S rRNA (uracil(1939)-C(5))-methyltransferase RlmD [Candidatus Acidoferrales bacterium]|nr:23S rRNA (uracil(1939)-C(5))-methyltransferase RlmD [Candidatus Acidoferrales bacterium]
MKVRELLTLDVEDLALGGKALARHEGRVVFVDGGLPGDRVVARVTKVRRTFSEAHLERIERASGQRIAARCVHASQCGGCRMQDLPYDAQCALKARQVEETLRHLGRVAEPRVRPIVPAPSAWHYRNKMEFSFLRGEDGAPILGLHERGTFDRVFALRECWLPSPLVGEVVALTQRFARERAWPAYHPARLDGVARFLVVRHLEQAHECAVHLIASSEQLAGLAEWARAVAALSPEVKTVTLGLNASRASIAYMEREIPLLGPGAIVERLLGLEFEVVGNAFLQTNSAQAGALYTLALEAAALGDGDEVLDLYCGAGTLSLALARAAGRVTGVESVAEAVERARRNATRNGLANARFVCGDARQVLREWARGEREGAVRPDVVVVDPPRAGLHPRVVARCVELSPRRIVYVSCNPATLARDAQAFGALGYALGEVTPVDMFPHTPHIECVTWLERAAS